MRHMASHCSPVKELLGYLSGRRYRKADEVYVAAAMATMFIHGLLSVSRILALYHGELTAPVSVDPSHSWCHPAGYHAPLEVYPQLKAVQQDLLPEHPSPLNLCVGKEWYRYPTSFMLPSHHWKLRFVRSEFRAQLPKPFEAPPPEGTRVIPTHFNDMNKEEQSRYVSGVVYTVMCAVCVSVCVSGASVVLRQWCCVSGAASVR